MPAGSPVKPRNSCLLLMAWASIHASLAGSSPAQLTTAPPRQTVAAVAEGGHSGAEEQDNSAAQSPAKPKASSSPEAVAGSQAPAQTSELPPTRTEYLGREIAVTMHFTGAPWLVRDSREDLTDSLATIQASPR